MMLSPVILFAYNRPMHLKMTLDALSKNVGAKDTNVYIFIDGPKRENGKSINKKVEEVALSYKDNVFRTLSVENSIQNYGLAISIITGVTRIIGIFGKVIIIEDDAVPAPSYLQFMNQALEYYEHDHTIWSIGGYTVPMKIPDDYKHDIVITQRSSSYAWATWKDRWDKIDWDVNDYKRFHWSIKERRKFNAWGNDRSSMLDDQMLGRVNSWAIRFDYAMYKNGMFNILPTKSLIKNIGHDGSGTHSAFDERKDDPFLVELLQAETDFYLESIKPDERIRKEFVIPFNCSRFDLCKRFLGNLARSYWGIRNG